MQKGFLADLAVAMLIVTGTLMLWTAAASADVCLTENCHIEGTRYTCYEVIPATEYDIIEPDIIIIGNEAKRVRSLP